MRRQLGYILATSFKGSCEGTMLRHLSLATKMLLRIKICVAFAAMAMIGVAWVNCEHINLRIAVVLKLLKKGPISNFNMCV